MKRSDRGGIPIFWKLMAWILVTWFLLLTAALGVTLRYALKTFQEKVDEILLSTVQTLAESPLVLEELRDGVFSEDMAVYLTSVVDNTSDLDYITIADANSVRLYHIDPAYIGRPFEGGDQHRALAGEVYLSDASPAHFEGQRRAFHPVYEADGTIIGFIMASTTHERIDQLRADIYAAYIRLYLMMTVCTLLFGGLLAMYLGRNLRGVKPDDLLRVYLTQNDILNALDEGLVSYDNTGKVRLVNSAAARMLGHREDLLVGQQVDDLLRAEDGSSLRDRTDQELGQQTSRANVLAKNIRLPDFNLWARQVLVLADKSEVMRYADELVGAKHMLGVLRANTHEFLNKMQVISGLLQMGYGAEAQAYIGSLSQAHEHIIGPVMKLIRNPNVAALILGKESNMRELDIDLTLLNNSQLPERSRYLSTRELVTVLGNLMENAMEAVNAAPAGGVRNVTMQITEDEKGLLVTVSDTGVGIAPENLTRIFEDGFSTKSRSGRGIGMKLIREIVDRRGGSIDVDTEPGSGTTFSLIFSRERGDRL